MIIKCSAKIISGKRKGEKCGRKAKYGKYCGYHKKFNESKNENKNEIKTILDAKDEKEIIECSICLENIKKNDKYEKLDCCKKSFFHTKCIQEWYKTNKNTCPLCRKPNKKIKINNGCNCWRCEARTLNMTEMQYLMARAEQAMLDGNVAIIQI